MTRTVEIVNLPTASATDVAIKFFDQLILEESKTFVIDKGLNTATEYILETGSALNKTSVVVRVVVDPVTGRINNSIRLTTDQVIAIDGVVTETKPVEVVLAWNIPNASEDTRDLMDLISGVFALAFNGVTTKVPNLGTLNAINRGRTSGLFGS